MGTVGRDSKWAAFVMIDLTQTALVDKELRL
jgi:hypothetical protein